MITLRSQLFAEELVTSGAQQTTAMRHVRDWTLPDHVKSYAATLTTWLADPNMFVRVVCDGEQNLLGLFVASVASSTETSHYILSVQLAPPIRRQGMGRALFADF